MIGWDPIGAQSLLVFSGSCRSGHYLLTGLYWTPKPQLVASLYVTSMRSSLHWLPDEPVAKAITHVGFIGGVRQPPP